MGKKSFMRTLFAYSTIAIASILFIIPCFIIACLPSSWRYDNRLYYWLVGMYYTIIVRATFLPVTIVGKQNMPTKPAIIIGNHQSALDIPLIGSLIDGYPHVWLFLKKYAQYPVLGFIARRMNVVVDHSGLRKLVDSIYTAAHIIKGQNRHVILFPEGGRYTDNTIHKFFYGFAILAQETGRPVIPVYIKSVDKAYPPHSFWLYYYPITLSIGEPFYYAAGESQEDFIARLHAWFKQQLVYDGKNG